MEDVDHAIRDLRNYIFGLRPGILADRQLDQALKEMASEFGSRTGVVTVVDVDGEAASVLASRAGDVVQLAREALSNVSRHAEATTCRISLRAHGTAASSSRSTTTAVGSTSRRRRRGMGLRNLQDRAESLGGMLEIESTPGEGTTVRATFPVLTRRAEGSPEPSGLPSFGWPNRNVLRSGSCSWTITRSCATGSERCSRPRTTST